jgi:hypothetical protein
MGFCRSAGTVLQRAAARNCSGDSLDGTTSQPSLAVLATG